STPPKQISSPSRTVSGFARMATPFTAVPYLLPKSARYAAPPSKKIFACWRDKRATTSGLYESNGASDRPTASILFSTYIAPYSGWDIGLSTILTARWTVAGGSANGIALLDMSVYLFSAWTLTLGQPPPSAL